MSNILLTFLKLLKIWNLSLLCSSPSGQTHKALCTAGTLRVQNVFLGLYVKKTKGEITKDMTIYWFLILHFLSYRTAFSKMDFQKPTFKLRLYPGIWIMGSKFRKLDSFRISKNLLSGILTVILFKSLISLCWQQWEQELLFLREAGQRSYLKRASFKGRRSNNLLSHNTSLHWHSPWLLHLKFLERIRILKNNTRSFHFLLVTVLYWKKLISINVSWDAMLLTILSGKNCHMFFPSPIPIHMFCGTGFSFFSCI